MEKLEKALELRKAKSKKAGAPSREQVIDFFRKNPNPSDSALHKWAEDNGFEPHEVEEVVYSLTTRYVKKSAITASCGDELEYKLKKQGKYVEGKTKLNPDPKEVAIGMKVETEHTNDKATAKQITLDHLVEDSKYYTHLKEMEKKYKKE